MISIGNTTLGPNEPVYIVGEIGINHNGQLEIAKSLIEIAADAGCDAVKFQKRTPEVCVPINQRDQIRSTPWGDMSYLDYRHRLEFDRQEYAEIDKFCKQLDIAWFASCWDIDSVDFIELFEPPCYKIASACLTDDDMLRYTASLGRPIVLSTGMSEMKQIRHAVDLCNKDNLLIAHTTSTYPCNADEVNLRMLDTLASEFGCPIGYSGHEVGLQISIASVAKGACFLERHITLDRTMWGTDQAASVEPDGLKRLVRDVRTVETAMGDGIKRVYASEEPILRKLRRVS